MERKDNYLAGKGEPMRKSPEQTTFYKDLGEKIRKKRLELKLSQDDLARSIGLTRTSLTNIENGRQHPPLHTFCDIVEQLKVDPSALLPSRNQPVRAFDVETIVLKQVRGDNELQFITAAIGIKNEDKHDDKKKKDRDARGDTADGKWNKISPRKSRKDR